jgi:hypothetical protein
MLLVFVLVMACQGFTGLIGRKLPTINEGLLMSANGPYHQVSLTCYGYPFEL